VCAAVGRGGELRETRGCGQSLLAEDLEVLEEGCELRQ